MNSIKKYDVFISYSRKDIDEVNAFVGMLKKSIPALNVWFDIDGIESGDEFDEKIIDAIENSFCVLFALSDNSLQSQWTKDEVMYAKNIGIKVIPILLEGATLRGWFLFKFGRIDYINSKNQKDMDKLLSNLSSWIDKALVDSATIVEQPSIKQIQAEPIVQKIPIQVIEPDTSTAQPEITPAEAISIDKREFIANGVSFSMVRVEGGTFTMGAAAEQASEAHEDEKPAHQVTLSDYMIGDTTVTQKLWQAVMGNNPSHFNGRKNPVENVSWEDCQEFICKLNQLTGRQFRLPTEAEWEYAARGGKYSKGFKYAGSNMLNDVAWYKDNSGATTHPVMTKHPNELGLYDMSGNVWEWCQDWCGKYSSTPQTNPQGPSSGSFCMNRGGAWLSDAWKCRVSVRYDDAATDRFNYMGLRLALSMD